MNTSPAPSAWGYVGFVFLLLPIVCGIWAGRLGKSKHRGTLGALLGVFLGFIGVTIIAIMKPKQRWFDKEGHLHTLP